MRTSIAALILLSLLALSAHAGNTPSWEELQRSEVGVEQAQDELMQHGFMSEQILNASSEDGTAALQFLSEADAAQKAMQATLDNHIQAEFNFFIERVNELDTEIRLVAAKDEVRLSPKQKKALETLALEIQKQHDLYLENATEYGTTKDWKRGEAIRRFFLTSRKFLQLYQQYANPLAAKARPQLKQRLSDLTRKIKAVFLMAPRIVNILVELVRNRPATNDTGSPLIASITSLIRTWTKAFDYKVEIEGRENIPTIREPGTVNILAPTHRDEILDNLLMGALGTDDLYVFGAADHFAPKVVADLADRSHSFVVVGRGSGKPIDKIIAEIKSGGSRTIYIYPEGTTSAGIGETHPPRENFVRSLIVRLKQDGFKTNLIPITLMNSNKFMGKVEEPTQSTQRAVVHKPITDAMLGQLLANGDEQAVNRVLRAVWIETLETDAHLLMGQLRVTALGETLDDFLGCQALLIAARTSR